MDYKKHYNLLIKKAQKRITPECYCESHHIVPRSMGGPNSKDNLVKLTGREHFIAHVFLAKIFSDHAGMAIAVIRMKHDRREGRIINSKKYEWIKKAFSERISKFHKNNTPSRQTPEARENYRKATIKLWKNPGHRENMINKNLGSKNPMFGKHLSEKTKKQQLDSLGMKEFEVYEAICVRPDSPKLGIGEYQLGKFIGIFRNKSDVEKLLGVARQSIASCLSGKMPQTKGYIFKYKKEEAKWGDLASSGITNSREENSN